MMVQNLFAGTVVIALTVIIHTFGLILVTRVMAWMTARYRMHGRRSRVLAMISVVFGLFASMTVEVWLWAVAYILTGAGLLFALIGVLTGSFDHFDTALYFSTVTFSTLGYGDVLPHPEWRLFTSLEGVNGFLLIGWSTAYLVAAGTRIGPFKTGEHF